MEQTAMNDDQQRDLLLAETAAGRMLVAGIDAPIPAPRWKAEALKPANPDFATELTEYIEALRTMDWDFEFSDDGRVARAGRVKFAGLRATQRRIDASGSVWNQHAPTAYRIATPAVREALGVITGVAA